MNDSVSTSILVRRRGWSSYRCRGAASKHNLAVTALVLVIAVGLFSIWRQLFGGPGEPPRVITIGFQCSACKAEYTMTNEELQQQVADRDVLKKNPTRTIEQAHCPKCQQKHTGLMMIRCPSCNEFFLPPKINPRRSAGEKDKVVPAESTDPVCPHCKTNLHQWHREHRSN